MVSSLAAARDRRLAAAVRRAESVRHYVGDERWKRWCRENGLDVYGMPGDEFAGPPAPPRPDGEDEP